MALIRIYVQMFILHKFYKWLNIMPQETIIIERNDCEGGWVKRAMQEKQNRQF